MKRFLIAVDLQKDFVDGALGTKEAAAIVEPAAEKIRSFDGTVIATLDTHGEDYLETQEGRKLPVRHCIAGTDGWRFADRIADAIREKNAISLEKNGFGSRELPEVIGKLAAGEAFTVELIGLCTDICVVSNALMLKICFPEAPISVDASCCAGVTPETHRAALETMKMCQIEIKGE